MKIGDIYIDRYRGRNYNNKKRIEILHIIEITEIDNDTVYFLQFETENGVKYNNSIKFQDFENRYILPYDELHMAHEIITRLLKGTYNAV
jgi:hypothetical protein